MQKRKKDTRSYNPVRGGMSIRVCRFRAFEKLEPVATEAVRRPDAF